MTLCAQARGTVSDKSEGGYTARTQLGAVGNVADPAFVSVNAVNVVTLGAFDQTAGVDRGQSKQTVAAAVGDSVVMELRGIVDASGSGIGAAKADSDARLSAFVGGCPTAPAPAASPAGLAALLAALGAGGVWTLRRRRQRSDGRAQRRGGEGDCSVSAADDAPQPPQQLARRLDLRLADRDALDVDAERDAACSRA